MKSFLSSCLLYLAATLPVHAAEPSTYPALLEEAKRNNPGVQAAYNEWRAELSEADVARALPDPKLTYGYFIESVETRVGPQEQKAGISQQLPWFGKRAARGKGQLARAEAAHERYRAAQLALARDLRRAYAESWFLRQETELIHQHVALLKNIERVAESRVRAGASASEVIKTQLEMARLEERAFTLRDQQTPINAALNATLNRAADAPIEPIATLDLRSADLERLDLQTLETNPALAALRHQQSGAEQDLRAAKKDGLPDFTLGVEWIGIGDAAAPVADSGKDAWMAGVGINLPLWRGKHTADAQRAAHARNAFDFARQQKTITLRAELEAALANYREAVRKIALYNDSILPRAERLLELNETDYRSGKASFLDLIDTQRAILRYQLELARGRADSQIHLAEIETILGRTLPDEK
mgnify:CR=1 FL=1